MSYKLRTGNVKFLKNVIKNVTPRNIILGRYQKTCPKTGR